jgi:hypothetical protein
MILNWLFEKHIVSIVSRGAHAPLYMWLFQLGLNRMQQWRRLTTCCCMGVRSRAVGAQYGELIAKRIYLVKGSLPETQNPSIGSCPVSVHVLMLMLSSLCSNSLFLCSGYCIYLTSTGYSVDMHTVIDCLYEIFRGLSQSVCNHLHFCTQSYVISPSDAALFHNKYTYEMSCHNHHLLLTVGILVLDATFLFIHWSMVHGRRMVIPTEMGFMRLTASVRYFFFYIHALFTIYFSHYRVLSKCDIGFTRVRGTSTDASLFPILFHYLLLKKVLGPFSVESSSSRTFVG